MKEATVSPAQGGAIENTLESRTTRLAIKRLAMTQNILKPD